MAIREAQLDTWSKQGAMSQSRDTYATIKKVLESNSAPYANRSCTSFLQGSYGNDTNIYADGDVDVVMRVDSMFYHDLSRLSEPEKLRFQAAFGNGTYGVADFRRDLIAWLTYNFSQNVKPGTKAIFIQGSGNRRDTDVLPAAEFRRYYRFTSQDDQLYADGICFYMPNGTRIENFPKKHSENCTTKHQNTNQWFKPMVRTLKNMRNRMIQDGLIEDGLAPSYYLEGLLYNVPNDKFGRSYADTYSRSIDWILQADRSKFVCANEQYYLLYEDSPVTWRAAKCDAFLKASIEFGSSASPRWI